MGVVLHFAVYTACTARYMPSRRLRRLDEPLVSSDTLQQEMDHPDDCKFVIYVHKTDKFVAAILELSCVAVLYLGLVPSRL